MADETTTPAPATKDAPKAKAKKAEPVYTVARGQTVALDGRQVKLMPGQRVDAADVEALRRQGVALRTEG